MPRTPHLTPAVVAFASGTPAANTRFIQTICQRHPEARLYVVAEFEPPAGTWIRWHVRQSLESNVAQIQAVLEGLDVVEAGFLLQYHPPLRAMGVAARHLRAARVLGFDHNLKPVPPGWAGIPRLLRFRIHQFTTAWKQQLAPNGRLRLWVRRVRNPAHAAVPILARAAQLYGVAASRCRRGVHPPGPAGYDTRNLKPGVSIVIPSRDGKELLELLLPTLLPQLQALGDTASEVIVSDNGSGDRTAEWLRDNHPDVQLIVNPKPLSFARAVNLGLRRGCYSHVFLLNNDMLLQPGCVAALRDAFERVPNLFCATAQIFFPEEIRREETGKAVWRKEEPLDFPVRCDEPLPVEDFTWVLYGSGGCSLFDTKKLLALGGVSEDYEPAYVEDMDFGFRAWKQGWPTVFCADAKVEHRHRATTSRFYSQDQLGFFLERNYLQFLISSISSPPLFVQLWTEAIRRLQLRATHGDSAAVQALWHIPRITGPREHPVADEGSVLALCNGDIAVFPGAGRKDNPVLVVSPYLPYPLSHGGAVRMFYLIRQANRHRGVVLVSFCESWETVPASLLEICAEVTIVRRKGTHYRTDTELPHTVEEFASATFAAVLRQTVAKWSPPLAQLEFTQMAQYVEACGPAKTILVEHDITFDLADQLTKVAATSAERLERASQFAKWKAFETAAWRNVNRVVVMSGKDLRAVGENGVYLPNGVDTERFQPAPDTVVEGGRLLFIGSFAHLPNVTGLAWFLHHVWPLLHPKYTLHVIAGLRPQYYLEQHGFLDLAAELQEEGLELEGFVPDVRSAYARAEIVIAPLETSAGTNIKVLEAMAMGKCIVSTTAGVNGLDVTPGQDVVVQSEPGEFAAAINEFSANGESRRRMGYKARQTVLSKYDWRSIGDEQAALYRALETETQRSAGK